MCLLSLPKEIHYSSSTLADVTVCKLVFEMFDSKGAKIKKIYNYCWYETFNESISAFLSPPQTYQMIDRSTCFLSSDHWINKSRLRFLFFAPTSSHSIENTSAARGKVITSQPFSRARTWKVSLVDDQSIDFIYSFRLSFSRKHPPTTEKKNKKLILKCRKKNRFFGDLKSCNQFLWLC